MNKQYYFENVFDYGNLEIEYILVEDNYPILFILTNDINQRFVCVCCDIRKEQRWIINPIDCEAILQLLHNKISLQRIFILGQAKKVVAIHNYKTGLDSYSLKNAEELDILDLPRDEYLDVETGEFQDYIDFLYSEVSNCVEGHIDIPNDNVIISSRGEQVSFTIEKENYDSTFKVNMKWNEIEARTFLVVEIDKIDIAA